MGEPATRGRSSHRSVFGVALTDLSALVGALVWVAVTVAADLTLVEQALSLAPLVLVPMGLGMAATPPFEGNAGQLYDSGVVLQPVGALCFVASLVVPFDGAAAGLAVLWVGVTGLFGLAAMTRSLTRGPPSLTETVVDAGLAYPVVGAVALVLYHLGLTFWFEPVIVLLTAIHFHYAGFVLPLLTGLAGRCRETHSTVFDTVSTVVMVGPAIIAVGISFSPLVEIVAVGGFTVSVAVLAGFVAVRIAPSQPRVQGVLVGLSAFALPVSMALALGYAVAVYSGTDPFGLSISRMVSVHGALNTYCFALLGVLGWRLSVPVRVDVDSDSG